MFNGNLPGNQMGQPSGVPGGSGVVPAQPMGRMANLPFYRQAAGLPDLQQAPMPGNTGIVPPHMQPGNPANQMYRQFIRGRLGIGGDPMGSESPMGGYGAGGGRPIVDWSPRPVSFQEGAYGAGGGRPIVDFQPRPVTFQEAPAGTGGFYPGGMHSVPHESRPYGVGGYGGFPQMRRSLYDEIG